VPEASRSETGPGALTSIRLLFSTAAEGDRRGLRAGLGLLVAAGVARPIYPLLFKFLVDGATQDRISTVAGAGVAIALLSVGTFTAGGYASMLLWNVWERMTVTIDEQLVAMTTRLGHVDLVERSEYLDHLTIVRTNREGFQESMMALLWSAVLALQVLITIVILASVQPLLLLLPVFSAAPIAASRWAERRNQLAIQESARDARSADALMLVAIDAPGAGELRVLRLRDFVLGRHREAWSRVVRREWRAETVGTIVSSAALAVFTLGFAGAVLLITIRSVRGAASIGSVVLVLTAGQQLHTQIGGVLGASGALFRVIEIMRHYGWLASYVEQYDQPGTVSPGRVLSRGIELEGVSFRYEGSADEAVSDVTILLPAGSVVAVVGENGAGKSTLVKLLCGLHRPSAGRILVDGVNLSDLRAETWRASLSGAFQDFVRLEVLARESVGVGRIEAADSVPAVRESLARADVAELEGELPEGLETPLGRAFLQGIDLSGGQWQKVALARAMMRDRPLVLVLDEPTYSLDVESERRVFEWFARVASTDSPTGTITVVVSHRFSTVRTANLIAVMHDGRLVEVGSHSDLVRSNGPYAEMYRIQAEGYRK
jgi:ATP-binding cassette, subfamily B, bacterial